MVLLRKRHLRPLSSTFERTGDNASVMPPFSGVLEWQLGDQSWNSLFCCRNQTWFQHITAKAGFWYWRQNNAADNMKQTDIDNFLIIVVLQKLTFFSKTFLNNAKQSLFGLQSSRKQGKSDMLLSMESLKALGMDRYVQRCRSWGCSGCKRTTKRFDLTKIRAKSP